MQSNLILALTLSAAAGMATLIGAMAAVLLRRPGRRLLAAALGFSGGSMLTVSLAELLPQAGAAVLARMPRPAAALSLTAVCIAGMLGGSLLDVLLPEGEQSESGGLRRVGIFSALAMLAHNLPEGIAVFMSGSNDLKMGISLAAAIALHNIPEGILVAMPVLSATGSRGAALGLTALSGLAEPVGALLAWALLRPVLDETGLALLYAAIAGLMMYLVFAQLLPAASARRRPGWALLGTLSGVAGMLLSLWLL